jgi:hypothetical protein
MFQIPARSQSGGMEPAPPLCLWRYALRSRHVYFRVRRECALRYWKLPGSIALRAHARITSHLLRRGRGAGTPACRVDTRVDPLTRKPQNAEMSLCAADTSGYATSGATQLFLRVSLAQLWEKDSPRAVLIRPAWLRLAEVRGCIGDRDRRAVGYGVFPALGISRPHQYPSRLRY